MNRDLMTFNNQPDPVDFERLEREISDLSKTPIPPIKYAPKKESDWTPTQAIGHAITKLTWREAELMAEAITAKTEGKSLAAALITWAEGWEDFK